MKQNETIYAVYYNMTGCLPDSAPFFTGSKQSAYTVMQETLEWMRDELPEDAGSDEFELYDSAFKELEGVEADPGGFAVFIPSSFNLKYWFHIDTRLPESPEEALAAYLECDIDDAESLIADYDWRALTDDEADEAVAEYIEESVWAFNASFLADMTELPEEAFVAMQDKCEDSNDAILKIIEKTCGLESFVDAAISADGRGHFLAGYDGEEIESGGYYLYRNN